MTAKRAALLKKTLKLFNDYGELELPEPTDDDTLGPVAYHLSALGRLLKDALGSMEAKGRTELAGSGAQMSTEVARHIDALRRLGHDLSPIFETPKKSVAASKEEDPELRPFRVVDEEDSLDRHYSNEVVDKLPEIVKRASRLSPLQNSLTTALASDVERYFNEAHQCYLYGFPVACAVLCRAILEASLRMKVPGKFPDLADRIEEAHAQGMLSQERRVWAYEVKDAGNNAIHQYERFAKGDLSTNVEECLLKTRAIVEELLGVRDSIV
jgi:hypothetical protein